MTEQQVQFGIEWAEEREKLRDDPNYKPEVSINGHIMNADCHEDYQRAMLFAVFDALSLNFEKEIELYMKVIEREKEPCSEQSSSKQWFPEDSNRKYYEKLISGPNPKKQRS